MKGKRGGPVVGTCQDPKYHYAIPSFTHPLTSPMCQADVVPILKITIH